MRSPCRPVRGWKPTFERPWSHQPSMLRGHSDRSAQPLARHQRPASGLGRPRPDAGRATRKQSPLINKEHRHARLRCGGVFLGFDCPARGHRV